MTIGSTSGVADNLISELIDMVTDRQGRVYSNAAEAIDNTLVGIAKQNSISSEDLNEALIPYYYENGFDKIQDDTSFKLNKVALETFTGSLWVVKLTNSEETKTKFILFTNYVLDALIEHPKESNEYIQNLKTICEGIARKTKFNGLDEIPGTREYDRIMFPGVF